MQENGILGPSFGSRTDYITALGNLVYEEYTYSPPVLAVSDVYHTFVVENYPIVRK